MTTIYNQSANSVSYPVVLEAYDNNVESGLISHKFNIREDQNGANVLGSVILGASPSNTAIFNNGRELETTVYQKESDEFLPVKNTKYYYSTQADNNNRLSGYIINKLYTECAISEGDLAELYETSPWEVTHYYVFSPWLTMDSLVVRNYTKNGGLLAKSTAYLYDSQTLLPSIITSHDSRNRTINTYSFYTGMGNKIPDRSSPQLNYANYISFNKNYIGQLLISI
ncbi:hypothetical protein [Fulvivirga ligni]|uniref:hypothetical protein n=1 Tax=Fulvivirga ligni TaxID=2904246 RepID=UPI001F42B5BE|nr:hypothetical protein [Fulvivirga ligni]UII21609.1 hypothetical protein LVD16_27660 [Fulvivirga ligni]